MMSFHNLYEIEYKKPYYWHRNDYFYYKKDELLTDTIKQLIVKHCQQKITGPIYQLTNTRYIGFAFNPVTIYYCYHSESNSVSVSDSLSNSVSDSNSNSVSESDSVKETKNKLVAIVLEVSNTPWNEKRLYTLPFFDKDIYHCIFKKDFHVSPFMNENYNYEWHFNDPLKTNTIDIVVKLHKTKKDENNINHHTNDEVTTFTDIVSDKPSFIATLKLTKNKNYWIMIYYPLMTHIILLWIHIQAFILWYKNVPYINPPKNIRQLTFNDLIKHVIIFSIALSVILYYQLFACYF